MRRNGRTKTTESPMITDDEIDAIVSEARRQHWLKTTGLPPPDMRGFVPRTEDVHVSVYEMFSGGVGKGTPTRGWKGDPGPGWDDIIRAYEEDR